MKQFENQFRNEKPETIGETDSHFDLSNYNDFIEEKLNYFLNKVLNVFEADNKQEYDLRQEIREFLKVGNDETV